MVASGVGLPVWGQPARALGGRPGCEHHERRPLGAVQDDPATLDAVRAFVASPGVTLDRLSM